MSQSWGHTLRPVSFAERLASWQTECSICRPGAKKPTKWLGTYNYVTGRAGRVSWARRYMCDDHAEKFRQKYQPAEVSGPAPQHALERLLS